MSVQVVPVAEWTFPEMRGVCCVHIHMSEPRSRDAPVSTLVVSVVTRLQFGDSRARSRS